jgi:hypothetical protein
MITNTTITEHADMKAGTDKGPRQFHPDIQLAKLSAFGLLAWNGHLGLMGDKWCPYDLIWILKDRIVGGRVIGVLQDDNGCYTIKLEKLRARSFNKRIQRPEFLAIAPVDKWMAFPVFLHRSEVIEGSVFHFQEGDFARDHASERLRFCVELIAKAGRP